MAETDHGSEANLHDHQGLSGSNPAAQSRFQLYMIATYGKTEIGKCTAAAVGEIKKSIKTRSKM